METSPNDTPMSTGDDLVDDLETSPNDTPMSAVDGPFIDSGRYSTYTWHLSCFFIISSLLKIFYFI
jgi:hypothetical protein